MRAAIATRYGPPEVIEIREVPRPEPAKGELLVRVHAVAVTSADARIRAARFPPGFAPFARLALGIRRPRRATLGSAFSGVIESVGREVTGFSSGDAVAGMTGMRLGAHAEYVAVPAAQVARLPTGVGHDDAAGVLFGGSAALVFLRDKAAVRTGASVLVNGASGAVGTNAVQLAKHFGANVTAVTSGANASLIRSLGADQILDHTVNELSTCTDRFDVVFDTVGNLSIASGRRLLRADGVLLLAVAGLGELLRARGNVQAGPAAENAEDFALLLHLVAAGNLTVVHDQRFDLDHIVAAHRRVDSGRKVGNVVIHP
ncbi:MAG: NAD(P)-dependent alcohol dehydrogenase [Planctomycetes bacterium]|jgi:NADPH:quinone reductase-like Zn-dependent oxidoreductase|nr:NAD(P)-dependent alcohol dehydrogenase [Planctomycetota bacterium]